MWSHVIIKFFIACLQQKPSWRGSLRRADFVSTTDVVALCPIGGAIVITIILHPPPLLTHLLFFIKIIEDDDIAIIGQPKKTAVKVAEELPSELLIP
jgi:hypothetical protein